MTEETKPNKKKRTRRNFAALLTDVESFCRINLDVLTSMKADKIYEQDKNAQIMFAAKIEAFESVAKKLAGAQ